MQSFLESIVWFRAKQYLASYNPYVIAVAGTYGREAAHDALFHVLQRHRHVRAGYTVIDPLDIPENILGAKGHKEHASLLSILVASKMREYTQFEPNTIITELPLFKPGRGPKAILDLLPRILVLTHIGLERVDLFLNKDRIAHEYLSLTKNLPGDAAVVLNADDPLLREIAVSIDRPVISYGLHPRADVHVSRANRGQNGTGLFMEVVLHGKHYEVFLPHLFAKQHVSAVASAIAGAHAMGIDIGKIVKEIHHLSPVQGKLSSSTGIHTSTVIDDSADTCPEQLESSLKSVAALPSGGRKICILGDMQDLGALSMEAHVRAGKQAASVAPILIFVGEQMRHAQDAVLKEAIGNDTHHFNTSHEASSWIAENIQEHDLVFVSGGREMRMNRVVKALTKP